MLTILLAAAAQAAQPAPAAPIEATLDALRARPEAYRHRVVRVSGQVDECWNMSCSLCPAEATPAAPQWERCLALGFDEFRGGPGNVGADMDSAFRYADVTIVARFDPECLGAAICTDRATVLRDARVERVSRRRRSADGLIRRPDPLLAAPADAARPVAALVRPRPDEAFREVGVFATASDPRLERSAVVCRGQAARGEAAAWPTSWQGAITARSSEDRYRCWRARRDPTDWVIEPN